MFRVYLSDGNVCPKHARFYKVTNITFEQVLRRVTEHLQTVSSVRHVIIKECFNWRNYNTLVNAGKSLKPWLKRTY